MINWRNWFGRRPLPSEARAYLEACDRRPAGKTLVADLRILALDAETSGFDLRSDRMLSLATIPVSQRDIQLSEARSWIFYQKGAELNEAVRVHGILPSETAEGQPEAAILRELLPDLGGAVLVGHHINFDARMLDNALRRHFNVRLKNTLIDTAQIAMRELDAFHQTGYPNQRPPSLDELCSKLGVEMVDRHTASGDTFTTAEVFILLCARISRRLRRPVRLEDLPTFRL